MKLSLSKFLLAAAVAGTLLSPLANAQTSTWAIDPNHSGVSFVVVHLGVSKVRGSFNGVHGTVVLDEKDITKSTVSATIDTTTVTTGVSARDTDLKSPRFFDIAKYPTMTFKSISLSKSGGKLTLTGDLTLDNVTKSITLDLDGPTPPQVAQGKTVSGFSASGTLSRSNFSFAPAIAPPMVGDEVKFTIDVEIDKK
jgi:polyisoprenoid-binding protein YceI